METSTWRFRLFALFFYLMHGNRILLRKRDQRSNARNMLRTKCILHKNNIISICFSSPLIAVTHLSVPFALISLDLLAAACEEMRFILPTHGTKTSRIERVFFAAHSDIFRIKCASDSMVRERKICIFSLLS